ncbi:hypothetical protein [Nocardia sp. NPDC004711]
MDGLVSALRALTGDNSYRENAARPAARIAGEDGAGAAVEAIEAHLGTR